MSLNRKNKFLIGAGAAIVVAAGGWLALSSYASGRAEKALVDFLEDRGMRAEVRWRKVSASPFGGSVRIDEVVVLPDAGDDAVRIARVDIDDFIDEADRKRGTVSLRRVANPAGHSPLGATEWLRAAGRSDLPPMDLTVGWDLDLGKDRGRVALELKQDDALDGSLSVELERIGAVRDLMDAAEGGVAGMGGLGLLAMLGDATEIRLGKSELQVRDRGYVGRSVELFKRYSYAVQPDQGDPDRQRDRAYKEHIEALQKSCVSGPDFRGLEDRERACRAMANFLQGDGNRLTVSLNPERPVSFGTLIQAGMGNPSRAMTLLKPRVGS